MRRQDSLEKDVLASRVQVELYKRAEVEKGAYLHTKHAEKILRFPKFAEKFEFSLEGLIKSL